ncbi:MAG: N-acetylmuramoyl-L-alanine amidase [Candidatus Methylacidiphilales bacterium]|nr:N-acetylmuramoyl-L-alanine amidase [Candidatus Methylacidiphilales bacterium]
MLKISGIYTEKRRGDANVLLRYALPSSARWLFIGLLGAIAVLGALPLQMLHAAFTWRTARVGTHEYVTLQSFCEFYRLPYRKVTREETFSARNTTISVVLRHGSGIATINGVKYTLSYDVTSNEDDWLISRIDIIKLFEPVIRPNNITGIGPVAGVVIDPGHGGEDKGALTRGGGTEKAYALDTARRLEAVLKRAGVRTVMTRNSDVFIQLHERAQFASQYQNYIFVSIHYNSASTTAYGLETYCCSPRGSTSTQERGEPQYKDFMKQYGNMNDGLNILLAHEIHRQIIQLYPNNPDADRGVKRARFAVLRLNHLPSVLVECGFLSNRMDASLIDSMQHRQRLAERIAGGIFAYMARSGGPPRRLPQMTEPAPNLQFPSSTNPPPSTENTDPSTPPLNTRQPEVSPRGENDPVPPGGLSPNMQSTTTAKDIPGFSNGNRSANAPRLSPSTDKPAGGIPPVPAGPTPPTRTVDVPAAPKADKDKTGKGRKSTGNEAPVIIYPIMPIMDRTPQTPARVGNG